MCDMRDMCDVYVYTNAHVGIQVVATIDTHSICLHHTNAFITHSTCLYITHTCIHLLPGIKTAMQACVFPQLVEAQCS